MNEVGLTLEEKLAKRDATIIALNVTAEHRQRNYEDSQRECDRLKSENFWLKDALRQYRDMGVLSPKVAELALRNEWKGSRSYT